MTRYTRFLSMAMGVVGALGAASSWDAPAGAQNVAAGATPHVSDSYGETRPDLPALGERSTLSDYLSYAALNNPGLEAAFDRWRAAVEKVPQMRSLPDPRLSYAYYIQEVETRVGPQRQRLDISQTLPWFGKLDLRGDMASEAAHAEREWYEATKLRLFHRVKTAYYEHYYLGRAIAIVEDNIRLLTDLEEVTRNMYRVGSAPYAQIIKAQVELSRLEDRLSSLRDLEGSILAELNSALNRPTDAHLPWPEAISEEGVVFSDQDVFSWLRENNPELKAMGFVVGKEDVAMDLARKDFRPDITLGLQYIDTDDALMPGARDSGKDPVIGMVSINLPIWLGKYRAAEREARARHKAALEERTERENELLACLKKAVYRFRDADRKLNLYRDTLVPKAEQSLGVASEAFRTGGADFLDLIDAERTLLEFSLSYERALADRVQALAEIEMLVGREILAREAGPGG
jgi:cobalt-zinc-cadmium efflux system outer membrane protein